MKIDDKLILRNCKTGTLRTRQAEIAKELGFTLIIHNGILYAVGGNEIILLVRDVDKETNEDRNTSSDR